MLLKQASSYLAIRPKYIINAYIEWFLIINTHN